MRFLFEFFPILFFFGAYVLSSSIFFATGTAMVATMCQVVYAWWRWRKVGPMLWLNLALIVLFGGATLWLQNRYFIYWKPTVLYWLFAVIFLGVPIFKKDKIPIRGLFGKQFSLPDPVWRRLNSAWALFFLSMGTLNLLVAFSFTEAQWVNYKLFGTLVLTLVFILLQVLCLNRYLRDKIQREPSDL